MTADSASSLAPWDVGARVTSEDVARMVRFAARWEYSGLGDEFIFPEFGIAAPDFYKRLLGIMQSAQRPPMTESDSERLVAFCRSRLQTSQEQRSRHVG